MVILRSSNRLLSKVEIEYDLNGLGYDPKVLSVVLDKYGFTSKEIKWKKNQMDKFRAQLEKERRDLNDLFLINLEVNRKIFDEKYESEKSKLLFINKERYFNINFKIRRLKNLIKIVKEKSKIAIDFINDQNIQNDGVSK